MQDCVTDPVCQQWDYGRNLENLYDRMLKEKEAVDRSSHRMPGDESFYGHAMHPQQAVSNTQDFGFADSQGCSDYVCKANSRSREQGKSHSLQEYTNWNNVSLEKAVDILDGRTEQLSVNDFVCILQKCRKTKDLVYAKRVHAHVRENGLESHRALGNHIVPMFVDCGSVSDAHQVLNRLVHRNAHSWTSLIVGYRQCGQLHHALNVYQKMQEDNVNPNSYTFVALLKACCRLEDVRQIHSEVAHKGFEKDLFVGSSLVDIYAKCGSLSEAHKVLNTLPVRNVVSWNSLIAGYADQELGQEALKCSKQMQTENICPDAVTFVCLVKACGSIQSVDSGHEIYTQITQRGFEGDLSVENTLVDMYAKCGSILEAQIIFDKLSVRSFVSWNALLGGYTEFGCNQEALKCLEQMQMEGASQNSVTFIFLLKACANIEALDKGREMHKEIVQKGFDKDLVLGSTLVDMYAKCSSLTEAQEVFLTLPARDVVLWNALIANYAESGPYEDALECSKNMQLQGISPNYVTFACMLKACGSLKALDKGQEVHMEIERKGIKKDVFIGSTLVDMYAKCGSLADVQEVFCKLPAQNVVSWTALIAGYAEQGLCQQALSCFEQLQVQGIFPNSATFALVLKACTSIVSIDGGRNIHREIIQKGYQNDPLVGNCLIDMYVKCGAVMEAHMVFHKLPVRDLVSWNALIAGYAEHGPGQEALKGLEMMYGEGLCPNDVTFASVLKACCIIGSLEKGREVHGEITQRGWGKDSYINSTLIDMYAKCSSLAEAENVFKMLPTRTVVAWNAMIRGYGINNECNMAVETFEAMQEQGVRPDAITFTCLLNACSHASLVPKGQEFFKAMKEKYNIVPTADHFACMVDLFARSGHLYEAEKFLESMPCFPSQETWNALLCSCKTHADSEMGRRSFLKLLRINPKYATPYILMANIHATAGRRDDALGLEEFRGQAGAIKKLAPGVECDGPVWVCTRKKGCWGLQSAVGDLPLPRS